MMSLSLSITIRFDHKFDQLRPFLAILLPVLHEDRGSGNSAARV